MAMTHDYLDYLEDQIGISPANSQEELQAAQTRGGPAPSRGLYGLAL